MSNPIPSRSKVKLGVVPTHLKFVGGLVPDEAGRLPRNAIGQLIVVENLDALQKQSRASIDCVQIPSFPGVKPDDVAELVNGLRGLGLEIHFILMVGGADPMNRVDEDAVVKMLIDGLQTAERNGVTLVSSTSIEQWMQVDSKPKTGTEFDAAVAQNIKVHKRAFLESKVSTIRAWQIEFLRSGEFQTFTDIVKCWRFVSEANRELKQNVFKVLVDAAHCGDSGLSIDQNESVIQEIGAANALGVFHASAKTTRGCLSTDDGWIGALLTACAKTGKLEHVFVEVFHHQDAALEGLRKLDPRHGIDTCDGRTYDQVVLDGLNDVVRRLNNLVTRGILRG